MSVRSSAQASSKSINSYVADRPAGGRALVTGGQIATDGALAHGYFHQPTIFDNATADMRIAQEEIFGPVTTIIPVGFAR